MDKLQFLNELKFKKDNFIDKIHINSKEVDVTRRHYKVICGFSIFVCRKINYTKMNNTIMESTIKQLPKNIWMKNYHF